MRIRKTAVTLTMAALIPALAGVDALAQESNLLADPGFEAESGAGDWTLFEVSTYSLPGFLLGKYPGAHHHALRLRFHRP